jgi:GMP synthase (glutamine-hydrolysing)
MNPFLIMRTGGTFPETINNRGDFEDWTAASMGLDKADYHVVDVQAGEPLPSPDEFAGCAITGSHDMVTDKSLTWVTPAMEWIKQAMAADLPIIGICFGHQLLAHALGGEAGFHPNGPEIGTFEISLTEAAASDPLFSQTPTSFHGHTTHYQCARKLPGGATLLAASKHEPNQAFRMGKHIWGVQFHPEFKAEDMRTYIDRQADIIREHGGNVDDLLCAVTDTPESTELMMRFVDYCRGI